MLEMQQRQDERQLDKQARVSDLCPSLGNLACANCQPVPTVAAWHVVAKRIAWGMACEGPS
eukprot:137212-Amphidinium_carterae.1